MTEQKINFSTVPDNKKIILDYSSLPIDFTPDDKQTYNDYIKYINKKRENTTLYDSPPFSHSPLDDYQLTTKQIKANERAIIKEKFENSYCENLNVYSFYECECGKIHKFKTRCNKRTCSFCNQYRQKTLIHKYQFIDEYIVNPYFLTLTLVNCYPHQIKKTISHLRKCIHKFFELPPYNRIIAGGVYSIELSVSKNNPNTINIHAHLVIDCCVDLKRIGFYSPFQTKNCRMAKDWLSVTGNSWMLHFDKTKFPKSVIRYILKYMTKEQKYPSQKFRTYIDQGAFGSRLISTFGCCYNMSTAKKDFICECGKINSIRLIATYDLSYELEDNDNSSQILCYNNDHG